MKYLMLVLFIMNILSMVNLSAINGFAAGFIIMPLIQAWAKE